MPFDRAPAGPTVRRLWAWLSSQELGILCGLSTVGLLAVGSLVLAATRHGASATVQLDDIRAFFREPSPVHAWFYVLCPVLALYGLNTLLATWKSVTRKWQLGARAPRFYAASVIHVAFLCALVAHLVGGVGGAEGPPLVVGPSWTDFGDGRSARVVDLQTAEHPDGSTRQVWGTLALRSVDGSTERAVVSYNRPLSSGFGSELFLLVQPGTLPVARLGRGPAQCVLGRDDSCRLGDTEVTLLHLELTQGGAGALARVQVTRDAGTGRQAFWLFPGRPQPLDDGTALTLAGVEWRPAIVLRHRHAPGNPWALLASVLFVGGLLLMWRRFLPDTQGA